MCEGVEWIVGLFDDYVLLMMLCEGIDVVIYVVGVVNGDVVMFDIGNWLGMLVMFEVMVDKRFVYVLLLVVCELYLLNYGVLKCVVEDVVVVFMFDWCIVCLFVIYGFGDIDNLELFCFV